jgi:hypothetical protein
MGHGLIFALPVETWKEVRTQCFGLRIFVILGCADYGFRIVRFVRTANDGVNDQEHRFESTAEMVVGRHTNSPDAGDDHKEARAMSLDNLEVVDAVGTEKDSGTIVLTILDAWDWDDQGQHLLALQAKINVYLGFVGSG